MNKRQVFLLWVVGLAFGGGIAYLKFGRPPVVAEQTARVPGQTLLASFPAGEVTAIQIQGVGDSALKLVKKDGQWTITERDGYPANAATVNGLLRTLEELKVTQGIQAGASFLPRFGLDESATAVEKHGYIVTFSDAAGKELAKLAFDQRKDEEGNPVSPFGGGGPSGRFIRNYADTTGVYRVGEAFSMLDVDPKRWLNTDFIQLEKIKSVSVSKPDKAEIEWKVTRETEEGPFGLEGAAPGQALDTAATDPLKTLFSYSRADDVIPADKIAERVQTEGKRTAVIETFEGLTYTIGFTPLKPSTAPPPAADPNNPEPPPADGFAVTVNVTGELPKERKQEADEKPEDAKAKDTAFAERKKTLSERLAKEKALAGRTFEVARYAVEALLKDRDSLIKKEPVATPDTPAAPAIGPAPTTGRIEAVTPPIAVPPLPEPAKEEPAREEPAAPDSPAVPAEPLTPATPAAPTNPTKPATPAHPDAPPAAPEPAAPGTPEPPPAAAEPAPPAAPEAPPAAAEPAPPAAPEAPPAAAEPAPPAAPEEPSATQP